jgi:hypothetical protein
MLWAGALAAASALDAEDTPKEAPKDAPKEAAREEPKAEAPAKDWTLTVDSTFNSRYVWRGIRVVDGPVWQPSVAFGWKGLTLSVWGNMDLTNVNREQHHFTELDFTLDYTWSWDKLKLSLGTIHYRFPNTVFSSTTEVYGGIGLDVPLSPTRRLAWGFPSSSVSTSRFARPSTTRGSWIAEFGRPFRRPTTGGWASRSRTHSDRICVAGQRCSWRADRRRKETLR